MHDKGLKKRINKELREAGLTKYALLKNEVRHLTDVIHADERIEAAINGRTTVGSVMLVATDKRVIYLDCKSFYTTIDEISYDVVAGVLCHIQGLFANVILHTRVGEYNLRFVNIKQAKRFVAHLEKKRLEVEGWRTNKDMNRGETQKAESVIVKGYTKLDKSARLFLKTHNVAVMSTIDRTGNVHGATVYYLSDDQDQIYILTKSETAKARNILSHPQVALTIFEEYTLQSLQIRGIAEVETDQEIKSKVFGHITSEQQYEGGKNTPPVTKIQEGLYVVLRVTITEADHRKFKN